MRPTTYAKHAGRAATDPSEFQLSIFAMAEPAAPKPKRQRVTRSAPAAPAEPIEVAVAKWNELAVEAVRLLMKPMKPGERFIFETIRTKVEAGLPPPTDLREWGTVARLCNARGVIAKKKGMYAPAASSHGSPKQVYVRGANA